jgi:hypothetical protein
MSGAYPRVEHLERLAWDKHSSLLWKGVTYSCKKFYNIGASSGLVLRGSASAAELNNATLWCDKLVRFLL